jgi:hypothetical protein
MGYKPSSNDGTITQSITPPAPMAESKLLIKFQQVSLEIVTPKQKLKARVK